MKRDFLTVGSLDTKELIHLLDRSAAYKADRSRTDLLAGKSVGMIFEKPSTRTRVSFEVAINELGGSAVILNASELQLGRGETIEDTARVLSRYLHGVVVRTFEQDRLERLARWATIPVINALSDLTHPCQALSDLLTIREHLGSLEGRSVAYVGDGNNVAHSLMVACAIAGMHVTIATPAGYEPIAQMVTQAQQIAQSAGGSVTVTTDPVDGTRDAEVVYTDVWASMGQEREADERRLIFAPYQVNEVLMSRAARGAIVLHCLPAHREEEITDAVIESEASKVWDQAENRLHTSKAVLEWVLG